MPHTTKAKLEAIFTRLIKDIPSFEVLNKKILPYGLKPHTRSICWLAEQVILQNVKKRQEKYGISEYKDPDSDLSAWDACLRIKGRPEPAYVNIKVSDVTRPRRLNDIASVQKLITFYRDQPTAHLFYVVIMLEFAGNIIHFRKTPVIRHYPWIGDFVINSRNHHLQSYYDCATAERTTEAFLALVTSKARARRVL